MSHPLIFRAGCPTPLLLSYLLSSCDMPDLNNLPSFDELPKFHNFTGCAWAVWGEDDQLGTVGMLTPDVVQKAAKEEIRLASLSRFHA